MSWPIRSSTASLASTSTSSPRRRRSVRFAGPHGHAPRPRHAHDTSTSGAHRLVPTLGHTGVPRRRPQAARRGAPLPQRGRPHAASCVEAGAVVPCRRSSRSGHRGRKSTCTTTRPSPASPSPTSTTRSDAGFTRTPAPECPSRRHTRAARGAALEGMGGRAAGRGAD